MSNSRIEDGVSVNSFISFTDGCRQLKGCKVISGKLSGGVNMCMIARAVGQLSSRALSLNIYNITAIRRRVNYGKTGIYDRGVVARVSVSVSIKFTASMPGVSGGGCNSVTLNSNPVVGRRASYDHPFVDVMGSITTGGRVACRGYTGSVSANKAGATSVRASRGNVRALLLDVPGECVRARIRLYSSESIRSAVSLLMRAVLCVSGGGLL